MFCHNCGKKLSDGAKFCKFCGAKQEEEEKSEDLFGFDEKKDEAEGVKAGREDAFAHGDPRPSGAPPAGGYVPPQYNRYAPDDAPNAGYGVLSFFFPIVGLILALIWRDNYPKRARSCAIGTIVGVAVGVVFSIILTIVTLVIADNAGFYYYY